MEPTLPTPHNNFFHFAISQLPNARSLIETQLAPQAIAELDLDSLQLQPGSFIDSDLREKFSDLIFTVRLASDKEQRGDAVVYFLFEHKSQTDPLTAFQLLSYLVRIWEKRLREGLPLCPIVPLVVYHGESGWSAARRLGELIRYPEGLAEYQIEFVFRLLDLSQLSDSEITGEPVLQSTLRLLKYSRGRQLVEKLVDILTTLARALPNSSLPEWIEAVGVYLMSVNRDIDAEQYKQTLASVFPVQFEPGSLADRLLTRGREEGREEGELIGRILLLQELLGDIPSTRSDLLMLGVDSLTTMLADLQQRLRDRQI